MLIKEAWIKKIEKHLLKSHWGSCFRRPRLMSWRTRSKFGNQIMSCWSLRKVFADKSFHIMIIFYLSNNSMADTIYSLLMSKLRNFFSSYVYHGFKTFIIYLKYCMHSTTDRMERKMWQKMWLKLVLIKEAFWNDLLKKGI